MCRPNVQAKDNMTHQTWAEHGRKEKKVGWNLEILDFGYFSSFNSCLDVFVRIVWGSCARVSWCERK